MSFDLRCHRCGRCIERRSDPVKLVLLFDPGMGRLPVVDQLEIRKRCRFCTWINVYMPLVTGEFKDTPRAADADSSRPYPVQRAS